MNVTGIIAEYNPLHCGHRHHLTLSRERTGADYLIAVMSGDYVQRGEAAVADKYLRTRMALLAGADLVLELPFPFCCSSAEDFASCGVSLLDQLGVVNALSFGSEAGDAQALMAAAKLLSQEPEEYQAALKKALSRGMSFAAARQAALKGSGQAEENSPKETPDALLSSPNNILGVEYLRALLRLKSSIRPVTIRREGDGYHETGVRDGVFASATALRRVLREDGKHGLSSLAGQVPGDCLPLLMEGRFLFPEDFSRILDYAILTKEGDGFLKYAGFSRELAGRLAARALETGSWQDRVLQLKTKNYTYTRISRALLSLVLDVRAEDLSRWREGGMSAPYARILGFKRSAIPLLSAIKVHSAIPLISKPADAGRLLSPEAFSMFEAGVTAAHVRGAVEAGKYGGTAVHEYQRQIVVM